jgi:hypothetical protein
MAALDSAKGVFTVEGKEFEVVSFQMGVSQATDGNNRPSARPVARMATIVLKSNENSAFLIAWAFHHNKKCDCKIETRKPEEDQTERTIEFSQAFCVEQTTTFTESTTMVEHITLSAEKITVDGVDIDAGWAK